MALAGGIHAALGTCFSCCKSETIWFYYAVMGPKDADGIANRVDPDQTAPLGAV